SRPSYSIRLLEFTTWERFTASLSPKLRQNLRRGLRGLNAVGHVEIGWCTTIEDAEGVLRWLFANKRSWAEKRNLPRGYLIDDDVRDFFLELSRRVDMTATPFVACVKLDGVPV